MKGVMDNSVAIDPFGPKGHRPDYARRLPLRALSKEKELKALMRDGRMGNEGAYSRLFEELQPIVRRMARRQWASASASDHDDLLQEVLLKIHAARGTYDPDRPFMPWLKTIVMNQTIDFIRKQRRQRTLSSLSGDAASDIVDEAAGSAFNRYETATTVRKVVSALPPRQRSAIELLKLRELSVGEAAVLTGLSASALKDSVHRALISLRTSLAAHQIA
jgi:RNA polymerase sigma-70 factor (ECF subfamily)